MSEHDPKFSPLPTVPSSDGRTLLSLEVQDDGRVYYHVRDGVHVEPLTDPSAASLLRLPALVAELAAMVSNTLLKHAVAVSPPETDL